ncbi:hypothetical protein JXA47_15905 [Candidatus Sumerlaeota bacterium]|nr:hypothetical protein [Candidatus Sumerlaeota bacterium]
MGVRVSAVCALLACLLARSEAATVYVVVGADTSSVYNTDGEHVEYAGEREITFDMTPMSDGAFTTVMGEDFRLSHTDSRGDPIVFTWWMLTGGWHQFAINVDAVAATRVYLESWREESERWGDEIALHFHHFDWDGSDWVMASSFAETLWDFEWSISQLVLDCGVLPVSFRSGWNYMDNSYQQELERWIPFRLEGGSWMSQDVPYHPSFTDYRAPGTMRGWEVRHRYLGSLTQATIDQIFDWAAAGQDQVTCLWSHQYESGYISPQIVNAHTYLTNADASHPGVEFRYVTAHRGMRLWQGSDDVTSPSLVATRVGDRLAIASEADIFQVAQPWVAARMVSDEYARLDAVPVAPGHWEVDPLPADIDRLAVAVCDLMGNVTIQEVRDGSRRWSSQTEFTAASPEGVDPLSRAWQVTLDQTVQTPVLGQTLSDGSTAPVERAYWIGQTFVPTQPGLSQVSVGVRVDAGPATVRIDLREVGPSGFPDMSTTGLLASAEGSLGATGDLLVDLPFSGLILDGRQYALVFLRLGGEFEIQLHQTGSSPNGNLVRAFSMDWIHIPAFDCRFQTFDQDGLPDQGQATHTSDAYGHETGRFLSQTFLADMETIDHVEVRVASASGGETLGLQLRRTEPDGRPDLSPEGLIESVNQSLSDPGPVMFDPMWTIPEEDRGDTLALTFVCPEPGLSTVTLERQGSDVYADGSLWESIDVDSQDTGADLWFRVLRAGYGASGTLLFEHDAGSTTTWTWGHWEADADPPTTSIRARFAFADDQGEISVAPWGDWVTFSPFNIPSPAEGRWIRVEVELATQDSTQTPVLHAFEVNHQWEQTTSVHGLFYR